MMGRVGNLLPPTPPAAEHCGVLAAALNASPRAQIFVDYNGAIAMHQKPQFSRSAFYGAFQVLARASMAPIGPRLHNIKAHVDIESLAPGSEEWRRAKGNDAADRYAKIAAARGPQLSTNELGQQVAQTAPLKKYLRY
eukprot:4487124-Pyramimonas_sp.AAC.1